MGFPKLLSDDTLSVIINNKPYQTNRSNPRFDTIVEALNDPITTAEELIDLFSPIQMVARRTADEGSVSVVDGQLYFGDEAVHNTLAEKILELIDVGLDIDPWIKFAENVYANPFKESRDELYTFLERAQLPITEDGCFIAYKKVNDNYRDVHSNTFDNSVGQVLEMDRQDVDANRHNHCSHGFHFCSESYLRSFGGSHVMLVKINPKDVVSIPTDYDFAKGRTCRYAVVGEIPETAIAAGHVWDPVYIEFDVEIFDDEVEVDDTPVKPSKAKKAKKNAIAIETARLGRLTLKEFKKGVADHNGSMAQWAMALSVPSSTVRNWWADLRAEKARRDALAGI